MKRLKILCITAALATTVFSSTVFADAVQPAQNVLDVDTAINMATENSYSIKKLDIGIQQAQNTYTDSLRNASTYNDKVPYTSGDSQLSLIEGRDFPQLRAKYAIFQYTNVKEVAENQLKFGVYQLYSGLISAKEGLDVEQLNFNNVEEQYKKAQLQLQLGTVSPVDVKSSEASYTAEKAKLNQIQRQYDSLTKQLNQLLGVDINTKYTGFTKDNLATAAYPKNYNEYVNDALTNRVEVKNDNENINEKKAEFDSVKGAFPYNYSAQYKIAKFPVDEAQNKLDTDKIDISIGINSLYNDLQVKIKKLQPEQKKYDSAKTTYNKALQSYNLGLVSKIDFDKATVGLKAEEIALKSIQRDIWLAQTKLQYASDIGVDATSLTSQ
jgi:outer membrane protein TolC